VQEENQMNSHLGDGENSKSQGHTRLFSMSVANPNRCRCSTPWLRRRGGEVHVVDLERRVERIPTEQELAIGIFATTH
jgi:hypothetical protein